MRTESANNNKVLMITYVFPPAAWVGAHRTLKYCKYLGTHGWTPIVLTAKPIGVTFVDESLLRQLPPDVVVHRTFDIDPAKWEARLAKRKLDRRRTAVSDTSVRDGVVESRIPERSPGFLTRMKDLLKAIVKDSPDSHIFWVPFAFVRGVLVLLKEKVDIIYCTTPPHSSHFAAFLLAKCFRKPYVLDFRDPWYVSDSVRIPAGKVPWLLRSEGRAKRAMVRGAARVICVSKGECDELRAEFPELDDEHFTFINNGYDPVDIPGSVPVKDRSPKLSLIHAGTIYPGIAGEFFDALQRLLADDPVAAQSLEVHLLGEIAEDYVAVARQLETAGVVRIHGLQPHARTLQMLQTSDVLVILMGGTKYQTSHLPSKFYEYLPVGKPILAIAQEGELTQMARQSGLGIVVPPQDVDKLEQVLRKLLADHAADRLTCSPNPSYIRSFERAVLAEKLAAILDGVLEARRANH